MKVYEVLHMNSGRGETSYATNSLLQQKVISMTRPITEDAITKLVSTFPNGETATLAIAELGCASGPNTFLAVSDLIKAVLKLTAPPREFHVLLNDLPSNDFNTIFTSLHQFRKQLKKETALSTYGDDQDQLLMLFNGVPGSFYGRLFPAESLHFAHSSYSLHWLSRGFMSKERVDSFNIPFYRPSPKEIEAEVEKQRSFAIDRIEVTEVSWNPYEGEINKEDGGYTVARHMRAVAEPLLATQFCSNEEIIDEVFQRTEQKKQSRKKQRNREMKVDEVLHMNSGRGETSYATNSLLQQKVISMTRPITEDAITKLVSTFPNGETATLAIAELGCASGPNTFLAVSDLIKAVLKLTAPPREFHVLLNDLPSNDFNTIFTSLHQFRKQLKKETALSTYGDDQDQLLMLFNGVPGSFYGRLFPAESLHFAHSSYSLHWLSRVPPGLEGNGGSISISSCSSMSVFEAYYGQFRKDFSSFLRCRAVEMVTGGRMVLTLLGRRNEDGCGNDCYYIWELMSTALNQMAHEVQ
ncbi:S-adenosyl-L-methionine:benzoic acid/salicylic acid carboxyl methyltransferase 1 [Linum perenne]